MPLPAGRTVINGGVLTINNLSPADSGLYECSATNSMGTKKAKMNVVVQRKGLYTVCFYLYSYCYPSNMGVLERFLM